MAVVPKDQEETAKFLAPIPVHVLVFLQLLLHNGDFPRAYVHHKVTYNCLRLGVCLACVSGDC